MNKIRLLFVCGSLAQSGNERWLYEICKNIDREQFEISVLCDVCYVRTGKKERIAHNFYYHELKKINVSIYEKLQSFIKPTYLERIVRKSKVAFNKIFRGGRNRPSSAVTNLIKSADVVGVIDFYNYIIVKEALHEYAENRFFILLHTHKAQYYGYDFYSHSFDQNRIYNFANMSARQISELAESGFPADKHNFFYAPLVLDLSGFPLVFNPIENETVVFSIFTRISKTKPLEEMLKAYELIQKNLNGKSVLNIYGEKFDKVYYEYLLDLISRLQIAKGSIRFMGHSQNIAESIKRDKVNIYWGITNSALLGYASIEIGAMGVPSIFWDLDESIDSDALFKQTDESLVAYHKTEDFAAANVRYASNNQSLCELSTNLRDYIFRNHHIANRIEEFQDYLVSLKQSDLKR